MAEFVEKRQEEQIPEMEEMERIGLITEKERRALVEKRCHLEDKLGVPGCCLSDYLSSLNHASLLLLYLEAQRQELCNFEKRDQIEFPIILRQFKLLTRVTRKFFFDVSLWYMRINFEINVGQLNRARSSFIEMTQKHGYLLSGWVRWAQFELDTKKDFLKAEEILLSRASCYHVRNAVLQRELFRCKLLHMEFIFHKKLKDLRSKSSCNDEVSPELVLDDGQKLLFGGTEAQVIYTKTVVTHPEFTVAQQFYAIANKFLFAKDIGMEIYRDIVQRFGSTPEGLILKSERKALRLPVEEGDDEETMLDCFEPKAEDSVEVHLRSYAIYCRSEKQSNSNLKPLPVMKSDRKETIERYLNLLDTGFDKFSHESPEALSRFSKLYVEQLLSLLYHCWGCPDSRALIASRLSQRCAKAIKYLSPELLLKWAVLLDHLPHADENQHWTGDAVVRAASELHPNYQPVQVQHLQRMVADDAVKNDELLTAYGKMQPRLEERWLHMAHHAVCTGFRVYSKDDDKKALASAIKRREDFLRRSYYFDGILAVNARIALLQTAYKENGLAGAREVYSEYSDRVPFSEEFQASMVLIELIGDTEEEHQDGETETAVIKKTKFVLDTDGVDAEEQESEDDEENLVEEEGSEEEKEDSDEEEEEAGSEEEEEGGEEDDDQESGIDSEEDGNIKNKKAMPAIKKPDMKRVRAIFELNIRRREGKHHDMWLVYILLEELFCSGPVKRRLDQRAQEKMEGWSVQAFSDMSFDIWGNHFMSPEEVAEEEARAAAANKTEKSPIIEKPAKPELLHSLSPGYFPRPGKKAGSRRVALYKHLTKMQHFLIKPVSPNSERVSWYDVLTTLLGGNRVKPVLHPSLTKDQDSVKQLEPIKQAELSDLFKHGYTFNRFRRREKEDCFQSSDKLQVSDSEEAPYASALLSLQQLHWGPARPRDDIDAMLATSKVLDPNFVKLKRIEPELSKKAALKIAKLAKTAGKGWDYMAAPEMTPEVEKSIIELLKMRGFRNPKQKFKTSLSRKTPKWYQIGNSVGDQTDLYNRFTMKAYNGPIFDEEFQRFSPIRSQLWDYIFAPELGKGIELPKTKKILNRK